MDAKDLRIEPALSERNNDASKYARSGTALQSNRNKSYQDIGSNPSAKVDAATVRPCAVIGPDRVVPPNDHNDAYLKKASVEPWPCSETQYHRPPDYPLKAAAAVYHNPTRNISPRQTFQENMQRIMVPPTYNSAKANDDASFIQKLNGTSDAKYCDVPYTVNPITNEPKNIRSVEMCLPSVNPGHGRPAPHGWPPGGINVRPQRPYVPSEMYHFPDYPSCAGPRPVSISRPHRTIPEESAYMYPETYYQEPNIRFKPYPNVKDRYPQQRYDYITNYSNPFHPPCPPQKYEIPKSLPPHPYSTYPHLKYVDSRMPEPFIEGYQRPGGQQGSYNIQYRNQIVHPTYGPMVSNNSQSKLPPYPPDGSFKPMTSNKLPYDSNGKIYVEYDNTRMKSFAPSEAYYSNEIPRHHAIPKGAMPNYPSINVQSIPPNSYYKKENLQMKNYEYINHLKNVNPSININNIMQRHMPQFSPNTLAISPTDSNTSNDTSQTHSTSQEDCGYVSQSSTTSIRSTEIGHNKIPNDYYGRYYDPKYGQIIRTGPTLTKLNRSGNSSSIDNKDKKEMDVRKFLQMWNEGDEDNAENSSNKEIVVQANSNELTNISKQHGAINNQEQLYVLGLVNVPSEDLSKYEHIQKVSKLPENIKGYNSIELLNQFEEVIESSNLNSFKLSTPKDFQSCHKPCTPKQTTGFLPRPISPLDVEAKISQSVIHKEVGCNFEIKPCSPKMLNVEIAAPVQNILNERVIEKVTNPLSMLASPILNRMGDNIEHCKIPSIGQDQRMLEESEEISSCKMINTQFSNNDTNSMKTNYSIQDFETNAGVCLASLPRLDNDIELHFPEVNQQFINANKGEPVMLNQIKDLPELKVVDHSDQVLRNIKPDSNELSPKVETEREFTKLSKYRKNKTNGTDGRQDKLAPKAAAFRTDSVIIKNPENVKASEIIKEQSNTNKTVQVNHLSIVNLSSQVDSVVDAVPDTNIQTEINFSNTSLNASEEAIDFRLNKDVVDFEINNSIEEGCEPVQLNKEENKLAKGILCENTHEVIQGLETDEDITSNIISNRIDVEHGIIGAEKDQKNDILASTMLFQSASNASNPTIGKSCSSETIDELDESVDLPNVNSRITEEITTSENEMLKLQESNKNENETTKVTISDKDSVVEPKVDNSPNRQIDIDDKSNIHKLINSDFTYEGRNINQPNNDNLNILCSVESPKIDLCPDESDIQQKEVTAKKIHKKLISAVLPVKTNEQKSDDSIQNDSMDIRTATISEQGENKEDSGPDSENVVFCDSEYRAEVTDSSNTDEGFVSIEEKPNSDQELPTFLNESDTFQSNNNLELTKHFNKCYGYGSKELYSPRIQNLIMFKEGLCRALSSEEIKPKLLAFSNTLDNSQLEDITSGDDCTIENINTTNDFNSIDYNIVGDASLQSKNDMLTDTNEILSSLDSEHLNNHLVGNDVNNSIQDSPLQIMKFENDRNSNLEINPEMVLSNTVEDSLVQELQAEPEVNICIDLISQNEPEKTNADTMTEVLNYKHEVNMDIEIISEIPPYTTTDKTINDLLVNEPHINSSSDTQSKISNKTTKHNEMKQVLLDEQDENAESKIIAETQYEEIQERLLDEPNGNTCIDSISNAAICEVNGETLSSIDIENSKQLKYIQQESKNKKEESAFKINMIPNKHIKTKNRKSLKRSLSDSALNILHSEQEREEISVVWPFKRSKLNTDNIDESEIIAQNLCNILQNNRRNSISAVYNEDNVSFCILIEDNAIITEDNEASDKICYTEISEDCLNEIENTYGCEDVDVTIENCNDEINDNNEEITENQEEKNCDYSDSVTLHDEDDISLHRTWVEDVACVETVVSDDIAEDIVISSASTPKEIHFWDNVDSNYYENSDKEDEIVTSSPRFDDGVSLSGPKFHEICKSPEMDDSEILMSNDIEMCQGIYDNESLEKILSESNSQAEPHYSEETTFVVSETLKNKTDEKENVNFDITSESNTNTKYSSAVHEVENAIDQDHTNSEKCEKMQDGTVHSCESSIDNVFSYKHRDESTNYATSSSPEVSSTTSEEKSSGILLKITNYNGSKVSQINRFNTNSNNRISCKFTEKTDYANATHHPNRPLITKAAQKYIPPIKETIHDLKVKLSLPPHSLLKLKQMKSSKDEPKRFKQISHPSILPKKPKPKFEDVLKSIDEIQIKMHKEKNKKIRKTIPKVVIKKNENGSHYASTSNKDTFNPDLTGRKWQPWVFLEKNNFIDKMATRRKTKAIFNHRKNAYVLAEKFHKYKSASSTKFVISQPKLSESSTGQLKYTIRLKHS